MTNRLQLIAASALVAVVLAAASAWPPPCAAQNVDQFSAELQRFQAFLDQDNFKEAARQAQYMLGTAERTFREKPGILANLNGLVGELYSTEERYELAEVHLARAVAWETAASGKWSAKVADRLHEQADAVYNQEEYKRSTALYRQALEIRQRVSGNEHLDTAQSWRELGYAFYMGGEYDKAAQCYDQVIAVRTRLLGENDPLVAESIRQFGNIRYDQSRVAEALELYDRTLAIRQANEGENSLSVAESHADRADCLGLLTRHAEAETAWRAALAIREELDGPDSTETSQAIRGIGTALFAQEHYDEADTFFKRALSIDERVSGEKDPHAAISLAAMGEIRQMHGRYAEAEPLLRRALEIREADPDSPMALASICGKLGSLFLKTDRYSEAETLQRRALSLCEERLAEDNPEIATRLNNLGDVLMEQGRDVEADPLYRRALEIREAQLAAEDPAIADSLRNLAGLEASYGNIEEAASLCNRALDIYLKTYGEENTTTADCLTDLAHVAWLQEKKAEAKQLFERVLAIYEKKLGASHPGIGDSLFNLAWSCFDGGEPQRAEELLDRAVNIDRQFPLRPSTAYEVYSYRALVHRHFGRKSEAYRDLEHSMELAEKLRGTSSGAELERADFFAQFARAFEVMVEWQYEDGGDVEKVLEAIERSRARSLLDEIGLLGADLNAGRPAIEEEKFLQANLELRTQLAELETALQTLLESSEPDEAEKERLTGEIDSTREQLYQQFRDARSSSVIYQNLLSRSAKMPALGEIQRHLLRQQGLMLVYILGEKGGFLVCVSADSAKIYPLKVGDEDAKVLGCEPGPMTAEMLDTILLSDSGVMRGLATPEPPDDLAPKLHKLWQVLVPDAVHPQLLEGKSSRLIVVPHGPLAYLPFEALVTSNDGEPSYLLDRGPPILYAPSVTVLDSLRIRAAAPPLEGYEPVLTVGDPIYTGAGAADTAARSAVRAKLTPLPFSGLESKWVTQVFDKEGIASARLNQADATEANVRQSATSRRVLHLACHGLTDQAHGNLFGALALTQGESPQENPKDDGFLSLAEIYDLNLRGCELAILSACETNYGPEQEGEGVWTLSRGFLVAGSRRVVASNWVVDDEAAASLVSVFCSGVAKAEKGGDAHAYGTALLAAKRHIRLQEKWKAPYYWASMVLIGPP